MYKAVLSILLFSIVPMTQATEGVCTSSEEVSQPKDPFSYEVEFGYQAHSGNTDSESLNMRLATQYVKERYRTNGEWKYYQLYQDDIEDNNQHRFTLQTDYKLSPKGYLYGNYNGFTTRYSAYYQDHTLSFGFGYQIKNIKKFLLEFETGFGYRYQKPNVDQIEEDDIIFPHSVREAIFRTKSNLLWSPVKHFSIGGEMTVIAGDSNSRFDTEVNITNHITEFTALKIVYNNVYHNKVPTHLHKRDNIFTVNLLLKFN